MIAVDTNILLYAHRNDLSWHRPASTRLAALAEGRDAWAIPWPCVHEFIAKATHSKIFRAPSTLVEALGFVTELSKSPGLVFLSEAEGYWELLQQMIRSGKVVGAMVHDARIAALCLLHGVDELWTADRDFGRFPRLRVRNPLIG